MLESSSCSSELGEQIRRLLLSCNDILSSPLEFKERIVSSGRLRMFFIEKEVILIPALLAFCVNGLKWAPLCRELGYHD